MCRFFKRFKVLPAVLLAVVLLLCACSTSPPTMPASLLPAPSQLPDGGSAPPSGAEIALIGTSERINSTFGQNAWTAISRFAGENGLSHNYYISEQNNPEAALSTLELALRSGAKLVASLDTSITAALAEVQLDYPDITFIFMDASDTIELQPNSTAIQFSTVQAGWLAGFMAAHEAYTPLTILTEEQSAASQTYAIGFAVGANTAAEQFDEISNVLLQLISFSPTNTTERLEETLEQSHANSPEELIVATNAGLSQDALSVVRRTGGSLLAIQPDLHTAGTANLAGVIYLPEVPLIQALTQWHEGSYISGATLTGTLQDGAISYGGNLPYFESSGNDTLDIALNIFTEQELEPQLMAALSFGPEERLPSLQELQLSSRPEFRLPYIELTTFTGTASSQQIPSSASASASN